MYTPCSDSIRNPQAGPFVMLRPELWHVTLVRAYVDVGEHKVARYSETLQDMTKHLLPPQDILLERAPWMKSWNFGFQGRFLRALELSREIAEWILQENRHVFICRRREIHVSWL